MDIKRGLENVFIRWRSYRKFRFLVTVTLHHFYRGRGVEQVQFCLKVFVVTGRLFIWRNCVLSFLEASYMFHTKNCVCIKLSWSDNPDMFAIDLHDLNVLFLQLRLNGDHLLPIPELASCLLSPARQSIALLVLLVINAN